MTEKVFDSALGDVLVFPDRIERRERRNEDEWSIIKQDFSSDELVDSANYRNVEAVDFDPGNYYAIIKLKLDGSWKRMFFREEDHAEACFKNLKYKLNVYRQNH